MKIRSVQMDIASDVKLNINRAFDLMHSKPLDDIDIVLFPEMFTTGYQLPIINQIAHTKADPLFSQISQICKQNKCAVILGSIAYNEDNKIYNRTLVFSKEGNIVSKYDKAHLFRLMDEEKYLAEGTKTHHFKIDDVPMSSIICYDLRFPELSRSLYLNHQIKILFVPMEWPAPRTDAFRTLLRARALENQCFVVSANRVGSENGSNFEGYSMAVDPYGKILGELALQEGIIDFDIDLTLVDKIRSNMTCLKDRNTLVY